MQLCYFHFDCLLHGASALIKRLFHMTLKGKNLLQTYNQEWTPFKEIHHSVKPTEVIEAEFYSGKTERGISTKLLPAEDGRNSHF